MEGLPTWYTPGKSNKATMIKIKIRSCRSNVIYRETVGTQKRMYTWWTFYRNSTTIDFQAMPRRTTQEGSIIKLSYLREIVNRLGVGVSRI